MDYELVGDTGLHMQVTHDEWELLLVLAERLEYWHRMEGRDYSRKGYIDKTEARAMSEALQRTIGDVPTFLADGLTEEERAQRPKTLEALRGARPGAEAGDAPTYFSGPYRHRVVNFINLAAAGGFTVKYSEGYGPGFRHREED